MKEDTKDQAQTGDQSTEDGKVYLVGAGPGDPELLTLKARRLLSECDVVLHDSLVNSGVLAFAEDAEAHDVGKRPDEGRRWTQEEINDKIVEEARKGNVVVRLKGGDPCVFGRGGEEAEFVAERGVRFEHVPGISSAVAAPEIAGIPLTHRDHASTLTVITGHEDPTKDDTSVDWDALSSTIQAGGTLVILMGVGNMPANVEALRERGVDAETPVAVVERATLGDGSVTLGSLENVVERAREADVESPATVVVGDVVSVLDGVSEALDSPLVDASELSDLEAGEPDPEPSFEVGPRYALEMKGVGIPGDRDSLSLEGVPGRSEGAD